jgi:GT2 family glycosyltransferase
VETDEALLEQLRAKDQLIDYLERSNAELQSLIAELHQGDYQELRADHRSLSCPAWNLAKRLNDAIRQIAPPDSRRRHLLRLGYRSTRALLRFRSRAYVAFKARVFWGRLRRTLDAAVLRLPLHKPVLLGSGAGSCQGTAFCPSVPRFDSVDVSIVIPVYNHLRDTLACLQSIKASSPGPTYEVIVVDDGSSDETQTTLSECAGLVYLRNPQNQGFIGSCNRGASVARGEYLVFLNNDTTVTNGWLDALVGTFRNTPGAGLAGAKLIYPDGRLQEAGGVIWRDASGWNYGNGDDPDHPRYNFTREVDYCSGACIMVPRALFHTLGGFDRHYAPAYYEDTDLAFKIRHSGHKVVYQPKARIIHHEGLTSGKSLTSGVKAYQLVNQPKFKERWADRLALHPDPPAGNVRFVTAHGGALSGSRGQVLVIDHRIPYPDRDSGSFRMMEILRAIRRRGHHVTFIPDNLLAVSPYIEEMSSIGIEVIHEPYYRSVAECLKEPGRDFRLAILSRCAVAAKHLSVVKRLAPNARIVFDTVDLHYIREERQAEIMGDDRLRASAAKRKRQELRLAMRSDLTLVVSSVEKAVLESEYPGLDVQVLSNIHPIDEADPPGFEHRRDIVFIGGFEHEPNIDAVLFFATEVLPRVAGRMPGAVFHVIGPEPPPAIRRLASPQIRIHGHVADVRPIFDRARVSVAPLRYGAGVKGKVNQSMALGVPTIVTSIAAEGMHLVNKENTMIADGPESFAEALYETWSSPELWQRISKSGRENIRQHFSVNAADRRIDAVLDWAGVGVTSARGEKRGRAPSPERLPCPSSAQRTTCYEGGNLL